jgi:hypothetical protein
VPFQAFLQLSTVRFYSFRAPKAPPQILHPKKGPIPPYTLDEAMYMLQRTKLGGTYLETELPLRSLLGYSLGL